MNMKREAAFETRTQLKEIEKMPKDSLRELYIDEMKDLYKAETQLVKALPKMDKAASNDQLRQAFEEHLRKTSEHVSRWQQISERLEANPTDRKDLVRDA